MSLQQKVFSEIHENMMMLLTKIVMVTIKLTMMMMMIGVEDLVCRSPCGFPC